MARIIVTDADTRTALAAVRSLARAGHAVITVSSEPKTLAGSSRYPIHNELVPSASDDPDAFVGALARLAGEHGVELVLPVTDDAIQAVLRSPVRLPAHTRAIVPGREAYEALSDKAELIDRARDAGLVTPRTMIADAPSDLERVVEAVGFPCVLKPHRSVVESGDTTEHAYVAHAASRDALPKAAASLPAGAYPVLVQERIVGPGEGVFLAMDGGRLIAAFAHRRIREMPVSGGASTSRESVPVPPELIEDCKRLLAHVDWHGAAMVEFKRSEETGKAYLMEVNGRLWGSLKLAIDAGVDFPVLLVDLALGKSPAPVLRYREGIRCRWFWGDVDHLIDRLLYSKAKLNLPDSAPSRMRALLDFLIWLPWRDRFEVFAWSDPGPWLHETGVWVGRRWRGLTRRFARDAAGSAA